MGEALKIKIKKKFTSWLPETLKFGGVIVLIENEGLCHIFEASAGADPYLIIATNTKESTITVEKITRNIAALLYSGKIAWNYLCLGRVISKYKKETEQ